MAQLGLQAGVLRRKRYGAACAFAWCTDSQARLHTARSGCRSPIALPLVTQSFVAYAKLAGQRSDTTRAFFLQADRLFSEGGVILRRAHSVLSRFYRSVHGTLFLVQVGFRVRLFGTSSKVA